MIGAIPIVTFDTSAHNRLADGGPVSEALLAGIKSGMCFRFAGLSVDEMVSCPDPAKRAALFTFCARLQLGRSDCIFPPNELLRDLAVYTEIDGLSLAGQARDTQWPLMRAI
jgi:hypothetical protein